jgi:hypothetical protein
MIMSVVLVIIRDAAYSCLHKSSPMAKGEAEIFALEYSVIRLARHFVTSVLAPNLSIFQLQFT